MTSYKATLIILTALLACCTALADPPPVPYTDVFVSGKDVYPKIRIPAIITTNRGTLLAFAEGRQAGDDSANTLLIFSDDSGETWSHGETAPDGQKSRILFANPATQSKRRNGE